MPEIHSKLPPSSAHRWLVCTLSPQMEAPFPNTTSEAAEQGTAAHSMAEQKVKRLLKEPCEREPTDFDDEEMEEHTDNYRTFVLDQIQEAKQYTDDPLVMVEQRLSFEDIIPGGFGTADLIIATPKKLWITDLKYGKGVPVYVSQGLNPQLCIYAYGAYSNLKYLLNVSGLVLDEVHAQPNRKLYDVLTKGSGDAREQPLFFLITTAGTDKESICYELHMKALDILAGRKIDHTFYPVVYGLTDDDDWTDEKNWYKANPSLGQTIKIERVREMFQEAIDNPAEENVFKQLRLNMWVASLTRFIPEQIYDLGNTPIDMEALKGRDCYGGLDLSSTGDITAFVLIFPPRTEDEKYIVLPFFWIPEDTIPLRVRRASVPYDVWHQQGYLMATEGNVIHYGFIEKFIEDLGKQYHILEIAFDRWGATQMVQDLEGMGFTVVPFGQGFKDMSPPTKEFYKLLMEGKIIHGGNPVLRWMAGNVVVDRDPAENIKPTKAKSPEKIDGIVATIMALDRCIRNQGQQGSVYDERPLIVF